MKFQKLPASQSKWWKKERRFFELVLRGAVFEKAQAQLDEIFPRELGSGERASI
ncbi:hypothetical protein MO867_21030 [Microbulbifer sp. OS29]|uniref:Uncharacterized protein n=1 Tax=Microbulbifer okhotskensis TaxID=2926617 RepID=A0A9X2EST8_9GAMM|nr:hypothetical protein [Microbulbifer okhotskensis]MCO1336815.1 hypothetical protein [Microbulbifer okhotskensis]